MSSFFFFFFFFLCCHLSLSLSLSLSRFLSFVFVSLSLSFVVFFVTSFEREKRKPTPPHKKNVGQKRYEKKRPPSSSSSSVRATFWEHRSFRARVILESPRRVSFRFVAFRLVFLPRARFCANDDVFLRVFFEKGEYILGLRKRGGGSMSSFLGRDGADANVGRKVRTFTRAR